MNDEISLVGNVDPRFNSAIGNRLPSTKIYLSSGLSKHMYSHGHADCIGYISKLDEIISHPDYVGAHPKHPNSMELVRTYDKNILTALEYDSENDRLYVASIYPISSSKLSNHLHSGRLIPVSSIPGKLDT